MPHLSYTPYQSNKPKQSKQTKPINRPAEQMPTNKTNLPFDGPVDKQTQSAQLEQKVYTVSELNMEARLLLDSHFAMIWLEAEISNFAAPASGHWYFTLKDDKAQVRAAMFRGNNRQLGFTAEDGMSVLLRAKVGLYEVRGDYQLIVEHMEPTGDGALRRQFAQLQAKLQAQGLFDATHKQALPDYPNCVGVVTSSTGAALHDIISVLGKRFPSLPIVVYPASVQGDRAAPEIVRSIEIANQRQECDVLIVGRGGGSLEDLWPFNEEIVAHAIYASKIPIVSAVGHEVDFSIADFVADMRAPTPSAAAEIISPDIASLQTNLQHIWQRLLQRVQHFMHTQQQQLQYLQKRLQHPGQRLQQYNQQLDHLHARLIGIQKQKLQTKSHALQQLHSRLQQQQPMHTVQRYMQMLDTYRDKLYSLSSNILQSKRSQLREVAHALHAVSPLATLQRGYTISKRDNGDIVRNPNDVTIGEDLTLQYAKGQIICSTKSINRQTLQTAALTQK